MAEPAEPFDRTGHAAWLRTRMAMERTLMAWIRTSAALIGFGFTIFQFFDHLSKLPDVAPARVPRLSRYFALALVGIGTGAILAGILQYRRFLKDLWSKPFADIAGFTERPRVLPGVIVAVVLGVVGLATFVALADRLWT